MSVWSLGVHVAACGAATKALASAPRMVHICKPLRPLLCAPYENPASKESGYRRERWNYSFPGWYLFSFRKLAQFSKASGRFRLLVQRILGLLASGSLPEPSRKCRKLTEAGQIPKHLQFVPMFGLVVLDFHRTLTNSRTGRSLGSFIIQSQLPS